MPGQLAGIQQRQHDLSNLMARASEGGGGTLIGTMAYRTDYQSAIDEEKVLRRVAAGKNCNLPPPAPTAPIPPAAPAVPTVLQTDLIAIAERSSGLALLRDLNDQATNEGVAGVATDITVPSPPRLFASPL